MRRITVMELKTVKTHFKLSMVNSVTLQGCKIGFEVPEIDSSGLVGLAVIGFEVPEIDSSGLVGLAVIGFEVPEINLSGLVGLAVLVQPLFPS